MKGKVIACLSCTGKTHFVLNNFENMDCVDHDMYDWMYRGKLGDAWIDYFKVRMQELRDKFEFVFVNAIPEIIKIIPENSIIIFPKRELKEEFLNRAKSRGGETAFPKYLDEHWDEWMDACENSPAKKIRLDSGEYVSDVKKLI